MEKKPSWKNVLLIDAIVLLAAIWCLWYFPSLLNLFLILFTIFVFPMIGMAYATMCIAYMMVYTFVWQPIDWAFSNYPVLSLLVLVHGFQWLAFAGRRMEEKEQQIREERRIAEERSAAEQVKIEASLQAYTKRHEATMRRFRRWVRNIESKTLVNTSHGSCEQCAPVPTIPLTKDEIVQDDTDKQRYREFRTHFATMSDEELVDAFNREVGNLGWVRSRGSYLLALRDEFESRGFDYSAIGNKEGFSLKNKVKVVGKKIESVGLRTEN